MKLKFELDDVMTTQEAAERWNVTADALKQNCRGRVKNGFKEGEFKKSGKMWLVTRQGIEYLLSYDLPEEISSIVVIKYLIDKKDNTAIRMLNSICLEWIRDELAGVHRQVFIVEDK